VKQYCPQSPLLSIHIPKCGGTSIKKILSDWFGSKLYLHYYDQRLNVFPIKHKPMPGICIHGHFNNKRGYGARDYYPEINQYITMLRHPFDITVSNYFYVKQCAVTSFRAGATHSIIEKKWSLLEYLTNRKKSFLLSFFPPEISLENYRQVINENFIYIGIVDDMQKSINTLAKKIGFPALSIPHENKSLWDEQVPDEIRQEFIRNNPLEIAIYEYALSHYSL
jgi:hypothetical protein